MKTNRNEMTNNTNNNNNMYVIFIKLKKQKNCMYMYEKTRGDS